MILFSDIHKQKLVEPCRLLGAILCMATLSSCDKVIDETKPTAPPTIPQASTEVFKQTYPGVGAFIFEPLEKDKTWQTAFATSVGKVLSLVDYQGEIIDSNNLVGMPKNLPEAIKQHYSTNYKDTQLVAVYDLMKSASVTDGYKMVVKTANNSILHLYYDASYNFVREQVVPAEKYLAIIFTNTEQVTYDTQIPMVVKQFVSDNQLKSASIIVYQLVDKSYKIVLNYRELLNGALQTSEILISETGQVLQWVSFIENNFAYKILNKTAVPAVITAYLQTNLPAWQFDYGLTKTIFGQNTTTFVAIKVGQTDGYVIIHEQAQQNDLTIIHTQVLAENQLPDVVKKTLTATFPSWGVVNATVVYNPYNPSSGIAFEPNHFQVEIKQGSNRHAIRFASDGKIIYQYQIQ